MAPCLLAGVSRSGDGSVFTAEFWQGSTLQAPRWLLLLPHPTFPHITQPGSLLSKKHPKGEGKQAAAGITSSSRAKQPQPQRLSPGGCRMKARSPFPVAACTGFLADIWQRGHAGSEECNELCRWEVLRSGCSPWGRESVFCL